MIEFELPFEEKYLVVSIKKPGGKDYRYTSNLGKSGEDSHVGRGMFSVSINFQLLNKNMSQLKFEGAIKTAKGRRIAV